MSTENQTTGSTDTDEVEEVTLPHQEVLDDFEEKGTIDRKKDLDTTLKREIGSIEGIYKKAVTDGDEKVQKSAIARSEKLANALLEFARVKAEKEQHAEQFDKFVEQADGLMAENNYADAKLLYDQAFAINPTDPHVQGQLAKITEIVTNAALQQENELALATHMNNAMALVEEGKLKEARVEYEEALKYSPEDPKILERITEIDVHIAAGPDENGVGTIYNTNARRLEIINDIEKHVKNRGQITAQELKDIGLTRYPSDKDEFPIGKKERDGKTITLVKVSDGIYKLKGKKTNWGLIGGIVAGIALIVGGVVYFSGRKKQQ